jgi:TRAP-type C4-dicarboxylate transport system permease small subunit
MSAGLLKLKSLMTKAVTWGLILAVALLVLDVVWGVFTRKVIGEQAKWTEELARFLLIWVTMLGGAVAFGRKGHLGVDYLVGKFDPEVRKLMAMIVHLIVLFFAVSVFIYGGWQVVRDSFAVEQMTPALGWKMGYVYMALPVSGVFMIIYTLDNLIRLIRAKPEAE